jgi:hypothetical protein
VDLYRKYLINNESAEVWACESAGMQKCGLVLSSFIIIKDLRAKIIEGGSLNIIKCEVWKCQIIKRGGAK